MKTKPWPPSRARFARAWLRVARAALALPIVAALLPSALSWSEHAASAAEPAPQPAIDRVDEIRQQYLRTVSEPRPGTLRQRWDNWRNIWRNR
jgi:hypothetical protein